MVGMLGLEPRNPEGADLQSAAVAAVPHPHSVFKHLRSALHPASEKDNTLQSQNLSTYTPHPGVSSPRFDHIPSSEGMHLSPNAGSGTKNGPREISLGPKKFLEPVEGVEPPTHGLQNRCSAIEPYRQLLTDSNRLLPEELPELLDYRLYPNTSHIHPHMCG